jgi:hypothetical protein
VIKRRAVSVVGNVLFGGMNKFGKQQAAGPELAEYVAATLWAPWKKRARLHGGKNERA